MRLALMVLLAIVWMPSAHAQVRVVGDLAPVLTAAPGETLRGMIRIANASENPTLVTAKIADYHTSTDPQPMYPPGGTLPRSLAPWLTVTPQSTPLGPKEVAELSYEIHIPADIALNGTWWTAVLIEGSPVEKEASTKGLGIREVLRHAVRLTVELPGDAAPKIAFTRSALTPPPEGKEGALTLSFDVANTGDAWCKPVLTVDLFGADGAPAGRLISVARSLYPASEVRYSLPLDNVPSGQYSALVVADGGEHALIGTRLAVTVP